MSDKIKNRKENLDHALKDLQAKLIMASMDYDIPYKVLCFLLCMILSWFCYQVMSHSDFMIFMFAFVIFSSMSSWFHRETK